MRLKPKLITATTALTFSVVLGVSCMFLAELLGDRIGQTAASNEAFASEVLLSSRQTIVAGIRSHPPAANTDAAFHAAMIDALRSSAPLLDLMNGIVRYSPIIQDVSITDAHGLTVLSTDPDTLDQRAPDRTSFTTFMHRGAISQAATVFGKPQVLDVASPLDRNGVPLIIVHLGIRSSFLRYSYAPWLRGAIAVVLFALIAAVVVAALLASIALRPLGAISRQLDSLTLSSGAEEADRLALSSPRKTDAVLNLSHKIDVLGRKMRSSEEEYSALQSNLNQMLDTLRDCVVLFAGDHRAILVSESTADFLALPLHEIVGKPVEEIFHPGSVLGTAIARAFSRIGSTREEKVTLENGRRISFSLERIHEAGTGSKSLGALLTLRDVETVEQFERELDVSRRLAAIGRLTVGVGHEVKNPINSMVLHLALLKSKLEKAQDTSGDAHRHVDVLTKEMARLDRVVQALADFSRPIDLQLAEQDLRDAPQSVLNLAAFELGASRVSVERIQPDYPVPVHIDAELVQQAVLNLVLNSLQAMTEAGGHLQLGVRIERELAVLWVKDNGTGISADVLPSIFNLYFTTKQKGSGIGLAMVYRIVQMHGGTIDVASETAPGPTRGTTFTLRLPLARRIQPHTGIAQNANQPANRSVTLERVTE